MYTLVFTLTAISLALVIGSAQAAFALSDPAAVPLFASVPSGPLLRVTWETAGEPIWVLFRLYRSQSAEPADWGELVHVRAANGEAVSRAGDEFRDAALDPCTTYCYQLVAVDSRGVVTRH